MTRSPTRIVAIALVALTAVLVGFQGASTLLTVTQLGASAPKAPAPKPHASLVPQVPIPPVKPSEPISDPTPTGNASETVPEPNAGEQTTTQVVTDNTAGIATALKAKAQAEMDAMGPAPDESAPPEPRRRYRTPRPELHKVY